MRICLSDVYEVRSMSVLKLSNALSSCLLVEKERQLCFAYDHFQVTTREMVLSHSLKFIFSFSNYFY